MICASCEGPAQLHGDLELVTGDTWHGSWCTSCLDDLADASQIAGASLWGSL